MQDAFEDASETPKQPPSDSPQTPSGLDDRENPESLVRVNTGPGEEKIGITVTASNGIRMDGTDEVLPVEPPSTNLTLTTPVASTTAVEMKREREDARESHGNTCTLAFFPGVNKETQTY